LILCDGQTLILAIPYFNDTEYLWNTGDITSEIEIAEAGNYSITVTNDCGSKEFPFPVELNTDCTSPFFFPNIFSPNDDGINDLFQITPKNVSITNFEIFDRWGNIVFSSNDNLTWNGRLQNQQVEQGVYILKINYKKDQTHISYVSNITVIR